MEELQKYVDCIYDHDKEIVIYINKQFNESKIEIREDILNKIKDFLSPIPDHYRWKYDGCPYDFSGKLVKKRKINLDQTILDFLKNEYTGKREESHCRGFNDNFKYYFPKYKDLLIDFTIPYANNFVCQCIHKYLNIHFQTNISGTDFKNIMDECCIIDEIYCDSITEYFISAERLLKYLKIGKMKLSELMEKK